MKKTLMAACAAVLLAGGCATSQQRRESLGQRALAVSQAVDSRQLRIEVQSMQTQRYGSHRVTSDFFLRLRGDTLDSYLPFLGRVYAAPYGSPSQGLNFTSPIENFRRSTGSDGCVRLEMNVHSQEDRFQYRIDVYPNGQTYIHVRSQERDAISFDGEVDL